MSEGKKGKKEKELLVNCVALYELPVLLSLFGSVWDNKMFLLGPIGLESFCKCKDACQGLGGIPWFSFGLAGTFWTSDDL